MPEEPHIPDEWTDAERWAWEQIRAGEVADFHVRHEKELKPEEPDGWDDEEKDRRLSQAFLATVLTKESFRCATPSTGVRIEGAYFEEAINLEYARLERQLWLERCRFHGRLSLIDLRVNGRFSLEGSWLGGEINLTAAVLEGSVNLIGSTFNGKLTMNGTEVGQYLLMRNKATFKEVDLTGAKIGGQLSMHDSTFNGKLTMGSTEVGQDLFMHGEAIFKEVDLTGAKIGGQLAMDGSTFNGKLTMNTTEVGQDLLMRNKVTFKEVDLTGAKIGGQLSMHGSTFNGKLTMNGTEVGRALFMSEEAIFKEVDLASAKIGGHLSMTGSTFNGKLNMNGTEVGQSLHMRKKATFKEVELTGAKISGQLSMDDSTFKGTLTMSGTEVGQALLARRTKFLMDQEVILDFARIGSNLDLSGATIRAIDLTGTTVVGELSLGFAKEQATNWIGESSMILRNTTVGAIQDADAGDKTVSWPKNLELEGFAYGHLGGFGTEGTPDIEKRRSKWFIQWLERDETFSPQPYERLANLLRETGYTSKANAILYAGRQRARTEAWKQSDWLRWMGMSLLMLTIGYGLGRRYFRALWWVLFFTGVGYLMLWYYLPDADRDAFTLLWASLDQLLPLVELNETHKELFKKLEHSKLALTYFYFHKAVGYILASFLVAGLAGLTQKN